MWGYSSWLSLKEKYQDKFHCVDSLNMFSQTVQFVQINVLVTNVPIILAFMSQQQHGSHVLPHRLATLL